MYKNHLKKKPAAGIVLMVAWSSQSLDLNHVELVEVKLEQQYIFHADIAAKVSSFDSSKI